MNHQKTQSSSLILPIVAVGCVAIVIVGIIGLVVAGLLFTRFTSIAHRDPGRPPLAPAVVEPASKIVTKPDSITVPPSSTAPAQQSPSAVRLRFDGLYRSTERNSIGEVSYGYLRFYEDGTVLYLGSSRTAEEMAAWHNKSAVGAARGASSITGNTVKFTTQSESGKVDYEGTIQEGALQLKSHSHINGRDFDRTYDFIPVTFDKQ